MGHLALQVDHFDRTVSRAMRASILEDITESLDMLSLHMLQLNLRCSAAAGQTAAMTLNKDTLHRRQKAVLAAIMACDREYHVTATALRAIMSEDEIRKKKPKVIYIAS